MHTFCANPHDLLTIITMSKLCLYLHDSITPIIGVGVGDMVGLFDGYIVEGINVGIVVGLFVGFVLGLFVGGLDGCGVGMLSVDNVCVGICKTNYKYKYVIT